ncbi:NADH-quinone oxidoreductase subunit N [Tellurirhabdus bombi]|uniref:NADH-quinone oxidoreductase subunit N n=1 Tax=Tellurirhabdus bombi TaxID=2907205 RepID=UPI001F25FE6C|nr:NADH-quinone oxidoreductase subunit N [Tellurirhabdus bombi]
MQLADQLHIILRSLSGFRPEVFLISAIALVVVADLVWLRRNPVTHQRILFSLSIGAVLIAGALVFDQFQRENGFLFDTLLYLDNQAVFFKLIVTLATLIALVHAWVLPSKSTPLDWLPILLSLLLGLYLMTMSVNLLMVYLSIEVVSISSYLLTALSASRKASEGGIKYLLFGAVSSAIMLYGISLLYGLTGTLDLSSSLMEVELAKNTAYVVYVAGFLTIAGILFKLSLVPFHIWTPDVYEAAPTPIVSFFSVAPKAAALLVLMRLLTALPADFQTPMAVISLASITLGNLSALWQTDAKRLLAYSTIAHAGFLLVGLVAFNEVGFEATTFYVATYLFINMAAFVLLDLLAQPQKGELQLQDLQGLGSQYPLLSLALTVVAIALTGLPPTVGFTAKLLVFSALWEAFQQTGNSWLVALFAIGLLNAVVSLFYYLKLPFLLYFRARISDNTASEAVLITPVSHRSGTILALLLTIPILLFFFQPNWLARWIASF